MTKNRMEAFSDGVLAIIITIMVLGLASPKDASLEALRPLIPTFLSYALSFLCLGIESLSQDGTRPRARRRASRTRRPTDDRVVPFLGRPTRSCEARRPRP